MLYFNFNGKTLKEDTPVIGADNRGLKYGDGLFETIKYKNDQLILVDEHFARLWKGMQLMQFEIPKLFTPDLLQQEIIRLLKKNNSTNARVRLTIIRGDGGLYHAKSHSPGYIIQSWPLAETDPALNENGLQLCIYRDAKKSIDYFSNIKHNNYLPYLMGALFAKKQYCNDAVILNENGRVCDTSIANIFVIKNEAVFTPSLNEGCISGVMRKFLIQQLTVNGLNVIESVITEEQLMNADEVFLTNSMFNIRWVGTIANKKYKNSNIKKIYKSLCKTNPAVFC